MDRKKIIAAATIAIMLTSSTPALADPLSDQLRNQQRQLQQDQNTYADLEAQIASTRSSVQKLDDQIQNLMDDIDTAKNNINRTRQDIKNTEADIKKASGELDSEQELFGKRVRAMYMNGTEGYIGLLLESESMSDFLSRIENISRIVLYDNNLIKDLKAKNDNINKKKQLLVDENTKLVSLQKENENKLSELSAKKDEQVKLVDQLKSQEKIYASRVSETQADINATMKQIEEIRKRNSQLLASRSGTSNPANASGEAIVAYASNFLGVPYVWGGNTPKGFDCSGFTKYVFAHFGISLYRRASEQALQGTPVSRDNLQPGDLVFFGNPVYHVGIYVGNNCFIHAPETGEVVKITSLKYMDFSGARRMR